MFEKSELKNIQMLHKKGSGPKHLFVLHGYGASMDDLAGLSEPLDPIGKHNWYFLNGTQSLRYDMGFGMMEMGRAWFDLRLAEILSAVSHEDLAGIEDLIRPHIQVAAEQVSSAIESLALQPEQVGILGFSQGAMMAAEIAFAKPVAQLVVLYSGALACPLTWPNYFATRPHLEKLNIYQSHGRQDEVLQFSFGLALSELIQKNKTSHYEWQPFEGGHSIPVDVIKKSKLFFDQFWN